MLYCFFFKASSDIQPNYYVVAIENRLEDHCFRNGRHWRLLVPGNGIIISWKSLALMDSVTAGHLVLPTKATQPLVSLPNLVQNLHNFIIDDKDNGYVQTDSSKTRNSALVERFGSFVLEDLIGTVHRTFVFMSF